VAKACSSCGFLNELELGPCLLCRRDLSASTRHQVFGGEFREAQPGLAGAAAPIGPALELATDAPVGGASASGAPALLAHEALLESDEAESAHASPQPAARFELGGLEPPPPAQQPRPLAVAPSAFSPAARSAPPPARSPSAPPAAHATFDPTRDASMAAAALAAAGYPVDYTPATLPLVDAYLTKAAARALDPDGVEGRFLVRQIGAYLGEVVVRAQSGVWSVDALAPEATCVSLRDGARFSPFVWLERRLADPSSQPLSAKYARVFLGHSAPPPARAGLRAAGRTVPFEEPGHAAQTADDAESLVKAAKAALAAGAPDDAVALAARARTKEPSHVGARLVEAEALSAAGRHEDALAKVEGVLRERPEDVEALALAAAVLDACSRFEDALRAFERALAIDPGRASLWLGKGLALERRGFVDKAIVALHKATQLDPTLVDAWRRMGFGYLRFRRARDACACFDEVIAGGGADAEAYRGRAEALRALTRDDEALLAFAKAAELGDADAWFTKATLEEGLGRTDAALRSYARYLADAPRGAHARDATQRLVALGSGEETPSTER
jgi:tetratricopeptide (TPR) repeat protein